MLGGIIMFDLTKLLINVVEQSWENNRKKHHILRILTLSNPDTENFEVPFTYAECNIHGLNGQSKLDALDKYVDDLCKEITSLSSHIKFSRTGKGSSDSIQALIPIKWATS